MTRGLPLAFTAMAACHPGASRSDPAPVTSTASLLSSPDPGPAPAPAPASASSPAPATDWCLPGLTALADDVCYVLPSLPADRPRRLLVYLHGIVPPVADSEQQRKVETAVLHACARAGVAALVPRGLRGIGPTGARDWWAWPTSSTDITRLAPSLVARWTKEKMALETIAGAPFARTYLAGSSNGAYLLAALAERGDLPSPAFPVDGFAAISGGAGTRVPGGSPRPFYVGYGIHDEATTAGARALVSALEAAHWPVRAAPHPLGHGANEVYLDEAFAFFDAQGAQ